MIVIVIVNVYKGVVLRDRVWIHQDLVQYVLLALSVMLLMEVVRIVVGRLFRLPVVDMLALAPQVPLHTWHALGLCAWHATFPPDNIRWSMTAHLPAGRALPASQLDCEVRLLADVVVGSHGNAALPQDDVFPVF